jgi:hypothetical protein
MKYCSSDENINFLTIKLFIYIIDIYKYLIKIDKYIENQLSSKRHKVVTYLSYYLIKMQLTKVQHLKLKEL